MKTPYTYAEWVSLLERFGSGDDSVLQLMGRGDVVWSSVVAERWTRQVSDALYARLRTLSGQLQTALDRSRGDYHGVANALVGARRGLVPLRTFVALPCLPDLVRNHLAAELDRWVAETQASLERSAREVRWDQGLLLKAIRDNPFTAASEKLAVGDAPQEGPDPPSRQRRIIL
jgi:hypothetical protein